MSYILEALKRSEQERHNAATPATNAARLAQSLPSTRRRVWPWLTMILAANAAVGALLLWPRPESRPQPAAPPSEPVPTARASVPHRPLEEFAGAGLQPKLKSPLRETVAARTGPIATPGPAAAPLPAVEPIPFNALAADLRARLPRYSISVHVYTRASAERFVIIDGRRYREGDSLDGGAVLDTITPRGVVLEFEGKRFQYPPD